MVSKEELLDFLARVAPCYMAPEGADEATLSRILMAMMEPPKRNKLPNINTIDDAIRLIRESKKIVVLSGAGISTSAGLPDFRSRNGIYVQIHAEHPDLDDPKSMFDIEYFRRNPLPFYQFAKALYPGQFEPTIGHKFIKCIEDHDKLLRNYTQNIDTLENQAGIRRVVECHGSFAKATCTSCKYSVTGEEIKEDVFAQRVPLCPRCKDLPTGPIDGLGVMKPNIVFFGEQLGEAFHSSLESDKEQADLLIVIGSSLKVRPVALIPRSIPSYVPQILINKEPLDHMSFDVELLGDCNDIIQELCLRLGEGWTNICKPDLKPLNQLIGVSHLQTKRTRDNIAKFVDIGAKQAAITSDQAATSGTESSEMGASDQTAATKSDDEDKSAIADCDMDCEDDWTDIDESSSSSDSMDCLEKLNIKFPESSFVHLPPNRYLFNGTELLRYQFDKFSRED